MAINLTKGNSINLEKENPGLNNVHVGLGWDAEDSNGNNIDCDVSVFMIDQNNKIPADRFFIFYNNLTSEDGSVIHQGDNTDGVGDGDDEEIHIELNKVSGDILQMMIVVTIHDADVNNQDFSMVENVFVRIVDKNTNTEICKYDLKDSFADMDSVQVGRIYRDGNQWSFEALAQGFNGGLQSLLTVYN
ncbi:MAG: TerD family protein [Flavobacteriaceae bacterium]|nr:TerD family protein [Flavobacteriaceae bacterium]